MTLPDQTIAKLREWAKEPDTFIAVFENKAMDSAALGERIALPFATADYDKMKVGETKAPDTKMRLGWKYILIAKCYTASSAMCFMDGGDDQDPSSR